ncbi:MAG: YqiA/YcfP family alpha/beta fold hydrolase [Leptolyngbyaceae cyanobacterium bins.302]|nr:YqiA/YcfP family alpha/beta fold hydrolase [Leptolyngbyaceae cyanobacterium bins.302]
MHQFIYLHGFASSPQSAKARDLSDRFAQINIPLTIPDLNQGDFTHLTLTRQLQQVDTEFPAEPTAVTLIGSSFGGLTAAWLAQTHPQVERLVLLAPAFGFLSHWMPRLGYEQMQQWKSEGFLPVYHYGEEKMLPISYGFAEDAAQYRESEIQRPVPTLIVHGTKDEVIPLQSSVEFASTRPWVTLMQLESDHSLQDVKEPIWKAIAEFCHLPTTPEKQEV